MEESNYNFFIPPDEINASVDWELVHSKLYHNSRNIIGELQPIYIAVNHSDPYKDSTTSKYRTHLRVLDGRHKYQDSKESNKLWSVKFVNVKDFLDFDSLRIHFGSGKSSKKQTQELKLMVKQRCEFYYNERGIPIEKIGALVAKDFENTRIGGTNFYRYIESKYLNKSKQHKKEIKVSKKDITIQRLNNEIDSLNRQLFQAKDRVKELESILSEHNLTNFVANQNA